MWVKNKGMLLESIINKSLKLFNERVGSFFIKRNLDINIFRIDTNNYVYGKLKTKSQADYYGFYAHKYYDFEAKETKDNVFSLNQIKDHQLNHLLTVHHNYGYAFVIIAFINTNSYYAVGIQKLYHLYLRTRKKRIKREWFDSYAIKIELIFPGIFDWEELLKKLQQDIEF
ncbi:Holliday junction resolvase RecU [Ureaplasma sp. ES3154-GEN]|uniref:Holliday junction resolvase RecU n=1 Tax=Ureaplasma sp. ES3154-GEN TaxID=2984844 RepID=UPI0021E8B730|nr:Holliday junction resolvase RecU [Ureaplasma sp. ES3154-GEN]MCV3743657.1 Holliday junction resolvase RecU [Ureaplasma sp. ES3154-GEN]